MLSSFSKLIIVLVLPFLFFSQKNDKNSQKNRFAEEATITGSVNIQQGVTQRRVYRGRAYRGGSAATTQDDSKSTPYNNTIISAHPSSFDPNTQPLSKPVQINQENATFLPHITPVTVGSTVQFINDDPFYHNVFSLTPGAKFNIGRRATGTIVSQTVPRLTGEVQVEGLGEIELFCDIHSQMNAKVLSLDTPYYVRVNKDGTFSLNNLPAGTYELQAYNPNYETITVKISLEENEQAQHDFNFSR